MDNVSFITIAKSEGNAVVNYGYLGADYARCSRYALKKLPRSVFFFFYIFTITIALSFCCDQICHAPYKFICRNNFQFHRSFSH